MVLGELVRLSDWGGGGGGVGHGLASHEALVVVMVVVMVVVVVRAVDDTCRGLSCFGWLLPCLR